MLTNADKLSFQHLAFKWRFYMKETKWTKTDTASIMFTSLTAKNWGRTFGLTMIMKDDVNPAVLRAAVNDVLPGYPSALTDLRSGFFWAYQIIADTEAEIKTEAERPMLPVTLRQKGLPNLRFVCSGKTVSLEAAHCIGDGRGVVRIFEEIMSRYVFLSDGGKGEYVPIDEPTKTMENAFDRYFDKNGEKPSLSTKPAFHFKECYEPDYIKLLFAEMSKDKIKELAHSHGMTVTEYLSSVLILGIIKSIEEPITQPITISVPVDLRRFFPTKTLRNFTIESYISFKPDGRRDYDLDDILAAMQGALKGELKKEKLQLSLNKFGSLKFNPVLRTVPYFIKKPVLALLQKGSHKDATTIFTNLGERTPPVLLTDRIERYRFINGDTRRYGLPVTCSCVSFNDTLSLCFSRANKETIWFDACVEILRSEGIEVETDILEGRAKSKTPDKKEKARIGGHEAVKAFFNI